MAMSETNTLHHEIITMSVGDFAWLWVTALVPAFNFHIRPLKIKAPFPLN